MLKMSQCRKAGWQELFHLQQRKPLGLLIPDCSGMLIKKLWWNSDAGETEEFSMQDPHVLCGRAFLHPNAARGGN